ncbi:DNA-protecting protein DprA [symbiont of Argiope bruennichi]|uniref:DNA-processing protein DprA n=1 Tax=symbiont of Argiope bruennichi TaxID=2810479 RepID=UPI003DA57867
MFKIQKFEVNENKIFSKILNIQKPPKNLYSIGDINLLDSKNKIVSIIGTRKPSLYGINATKKLISGLKNKNIVVISGFALGIDSLVHQECLKNNIKTVAITAFGFKHIYPKINKNLFLEIAKNGLVISEFEPNIASKKEYFKQRNRLISGFSQLLIVIESKRKSGTLNTVMHAIDQNIDIGVVPFPIFDDQSNNTLIKNGAFLIESSTDILDLLK